MILDLSSLAYRDPRLLDCRFHGLGVYVLTFFQERLNSLSDRLARLGLASPMR
jgi:hypothetical protein